MKDLAQPFPPLLPGASRDILPSKVSSPSEISSSSEQMLRMFTSISVTARGTDREVREAWACRGIGRTREGFQGRLSPASGSLKTLLGTACWYPQRRRSRRHTLHLLPRRWMQAKHITEEPDVGKEVPTFLQNSLSSLKVPPPHPHPRHSHLALRRAKSGERGIRSLVPPNQKTLWKW